MFHATTAWVVVRLAYSAFLSLAAGASHSAGTLAFTTIRLAKSLSRFDGLGWDHGGNGDGAGTGRQREQPVKQVCEGFGRARRNSEQGSIELSKSDLNLPMTRKNHFQQPIYEYEKKSFRLYCPRITPRRQKPAQLQCWNLPRNERYYE